MGLRRKNEISEIERNLEADALEPIRDAGDFRVTAWEGRLEGSKKLDWIEDSPEAVVGRAKQILDALPGSRVTITFTTQITVEGTDKFHQRHEGRVEE